MKRINILLGTSAMAVVGVFGLSTLLSKEEKNAYVKNDLPSFLPQTNGTGAAEWWKSQLIDRTTGELMTPETYRMQKEAFAMSTKSVTLSWDERGPDNIGGRTRAIVIDRNNTSNILAGSVSGGLFKSTNGGNTWSRITNFPGTMFIASATQLANGAIVIATGVSGSVGELGDLTGNGNGIFYTTDFADSWTIVPGTATFNNVREIVNGNNQNRLWISTSSGLQYWDYGTAALTSSALAGVVNGALAISGDGSVIICQKASSHFLSSDGGATWTNVTGPSGSVTKPIPSSGRSEYTVSPSTVNGKYTVYVALTDANGRGMFKSSDNGATWGRIFGATTSGGINDIYRDQGGYGSTVGVSNNNPNKIFIGGIDVWKWQEGPSEFSGQLAQISNWFVNPSSPDYVHADVHEFKWANNSTFYIGNDGGIGKSTNGATTFYPANRGYNVTQFYGVAFDAFGAVAGGAQDNGTLYNNGSNTTPQSFDEIGGGDGFETEISHFNKDIIFGTVYGNATNRSSNGGLSTGLFAPPYPADYPAIGGFGGAIFPFHTEIKLAEHYDLNSRDSVVFKALGASVLTGTTVTVPSSTRGRSISYTATSNLYFSDSAVANPALTITDYNITNGSTGIVYPLSSLTFTCGSCGPTPVVGDVLQVTSPSVFTLTISAVSAPYTHYFAQHPSGYIFDLGTETIRFNVSWNSVNVQDPYQSLFLVYTGKNNGELWATKDALRVAKANPEWSLIAKNIGAVNGSIGGNIDIEISENFNAIFVGTSSGVRRITGMDVLYNSQPDFFTQSSYNYLTTNTVAPTGITVSTITGSGANAMSIDKRNPNKMVIGDISPGAIRVSNNAMAGSPTFTTKTPVGTVIFDILMDRNNSNILVAATLFGVKTSTDGGTTWANSSAGFEGVPVVEIEQQWRTGQEETTKPGEIYIATFGRGIFSSSSLLGLNDVISNNSNKTTIETLDIFPNPTASNAAISLNLRENGKVTIHIYNLTGSLVKTITTEPLTEGKQLIQLDSETLGSGTYLLKATSGKQTANGKLIKM